VKGLGVVSLLFIAGMLAACGGTRPIRPFTTDGCSRFPDGTPGENDLWQSCCVEHDVAYWQGGTRRDRKRADQKLEACVEEVRNPALARVMYRGVRAGGAPWWPASYRWGYGWRYGRGYEPLTPEEERNVARQLADRVVTDSESDLRE
jgi:hypothetical protein